MKRISVFTLAILLLLTLVYPLTAQDEAEPEEVAFEVEKLHDGFIITSIVWDADGRMFYTEGKDGKVRLVDADGVLQEEPVVSVEVRTESEDGLHSIVLDPAFAENHYFYIYYTPVPNNEPQVNLVVRYTEENGIGVAPLELYRIDAPSDLYQHNGGRMRFGPEDGLLYMSIGDLSQYDIVQDINRVEAKLHRFQISGNRLAPAPGNPFPGNSAYAIGLRNVFSFVFDPYTNRIFGTENGPDCDDEINLILPNQNYGWGLVPFRYNAGYCQTVNRSLGARPPLINFTPTIAPTGIMIYNGEAFPEWQGQLFYCAFNTNEMYRVALNEQRSAFEGDPVIVDTGEIEQSCAVEIAQGPDGYIYYSALEALYRLVPAD